MEHESWTPVDTRDYEGEAQDQCPECGHPKRTTPRRPSKIRQWLNLKPLPASCRERVEDVSGWGDTCDCEHACHGS